MDIINQMDGNTKHKKLLKYIIFIFLTMCPAIIFLYYVNMGKPLSFKFIRLIANNKFVFIVLSLTVSFILIIILNRFKRFNFRNIFNVFIIESSSLAIILYFIVIKPALRSIDIKSSFLNDMLKLSFFVIMIAIALYLIISNKKSIFEKFKKDRKI